MQVGTMAFRLRACVSWQRAYAHKRAFARCIFSTETRVVAFLCYV